MLAEFVLEIAEDDGVCPRTQILPVHMDECTRGNTFASARNLSLPAVTSHQPAQIRSQVSSAVV